MLHVTDGPHDQHQRADRREQLATGERPLPGVKFYVSPEPRETAAQAEARRRQIAQATGTSRMCWR